MYWAASSSAAMRAASAAAAAASASRSSRASYMIIRVRPVSHEGYNRVVSKNHDGPFLRAARRLRPVTQQAP